VIPVSTESTPPGVLPITGFNLEGMAAFAGGLLLIGGGALLAARTAGRRGTGRRGLFKRGLFKRNRR
jgi:hypothetical protein